MCRLFVVGTNIGYVAMCLRYSRGATAYVHSNIRDRYMKYQPLEERLSGDLTALRYLHG